MTVWALLWELIKHILHRRGRDEVLVSVVVDGGRMASGSAAEFTWAGDEDAFCHIKADGVLEHVYEALDEVPS